MQTKAKYYIETEEIVPLPKRKPSLVALDEPEEKIPHKGIDEKGEWILVDFISDDKDTYYGYNVESIKNDNGDVIDQRVTRKKLGEEEWSQI